MGDVDRVGEPLITSEINKETLRQCVAGFRFSVRKKYSETLRAFKKGNGAFIREFPEPDTAWPLLWKMHEEKIGSWILNLSRARPLFRSDFHTCDFLSQTNVLND